MDNIFEVILRNILIVYIVLITIVYVSIVIIRIVRNKEVCGRRFKDRNLFLSVYVIVEPLN